MSEQQLKNIKSKLDQILHLLTKGNISTQQKNEAAKQLRSEGINVNNSEEVSGSTFNYDEPYIMISYNWGKQDLAKKIVEKLKNSGIKVWFDLDNMEGSLTDSMSEAVEGAIVVLPFLSQAYQNSKNCKLELEYAHNQNKLILPIMTQDQWAPRKWLGFLVNSKLYIDFRD